MSASDLLLRVTHFRAASRTFALTKDEIIIGRAPECDVVLEWVNVSRQHARLQISPQGMLLTDLGSTNGTQLNGAPLSPRRPAALAVGQPFQVADFTLVVEVQSARPAPHHLDAAQSPGFSAAMGSATLIAADFPDGLQAGPQNLDLSAQTRITIGRGADNSLVINHPMVSRCHAEIERVGARVLIRDLHSTNGVFVNGQRVKDSCWLKDGDKVQIGPLVFSLSGLSLRQMTEAGLTLKATNINKYVSSRLNLLKNISVQIKPMEFVAIVGMSGSGKTTLLNVLSGYSPATDGQVTVNGMDLYKFYDQFRNDMGYVPQKDIVHTELTPFTALMYVARLRMPADTTEPERRKAVIEVLEELDLTERKDLPIARLSGGQLKRVSIGVELLTRPRLFFLDEPTSGLDPGTEYDMMRLLRQLADQGRTVMLVTHATKNVLLCDKVLFLARGGYLAFYGPPDEALTYFDQYRTHRERTQKEMEFDDIYRILEDDKRGTPVEWNARFMTSRYYRAALGDSSAQPGQDSGFPGAARVRAQKKAGTQKVSALQQFFILSSRNLKIILQDRVSLALMLALAPGIGLLDFMWGRKLYDPIKGDALKIMTMWFMTALITILVGALASVREIVKETDIYRRERAVNLKLVPYLLSKVWVGVILAIYQAGVLLLTRILFNQPVVSGAGGYMQLYVTLFLCTLCGYLIGLVISASAPNQNSAMLLIIAVLVPQFLFAGALLPLDLIPGGEAISVVMPTRWGFEAFLNSSGIGELLNQDPCWQVPKSERKKMSEEQKKDCACLGINIFTRCNTFPGILSKDYYGPGVMSLLALPRPSEPAQPTALPYPTSLPSPTPLPTPTLLPSPTPLPIPADLRDLESYMQDARNQGKTYQDSILKQFDLYRLQSEEQGQLYGDLRSAQGDEYASARQAQGDAYQAAMQQYAEQRSNYEEARQKAVGSAEAILEGMVDNYGRAFGGNVPERWLKISLIMTALMGFLIFFQKRKDLI